MKRSMFVLIISLAIIFGFFSSSLSASTLVGAWTFTNSSLADVSGVAPALNGTLQNGAAIVTDVTRGKVLSPSNTGSGGLLLGYDVKLYSARSITIQYWHKRKASPGQSWGYVVGAGGSGPRHFNNISGMIYYMSTSDNNDVPINYWKATDTSWHHVVATYDGTYLYGYVDGVLVQKKFRGGSIIGGDNYWAIGHEWNGNAGGGWNPNGGSCTDYIDDVAIWNGYAPPAVVLGLKNGTYTIFTAPIEEVYNPPLNFIAADFDRTGLVNSVDLDSLSDKWLQDCTIVDCCGVNLYTGDNTVTFNDFSIFANNWLYENSTGKLVTIENLMGVPTFKVDSNFTTVGLFSHNWPKPPCPVKGFADTGTIFQDYGGYSTGTSWLKTNPDKWDYANSTDQRIDFLFDPVTGDPDVLLIPWIAVESPKWWINDPANQAELEMVDSGSGPTVIQIMTENDQPVERKFASIASDKWRRDMAHSLENYIEYLYRWGYMKNMAGFKLSDIGCGGENLWRTAHSNYLGGYGTRTIEAFRNWLKVRYNNDVAELREAWNNPTITFETATTPTRANRTLYSTSRTFRDPTAYLDVIDFELFWNDLVVETMDYFAGVIKRKTNNTKLVGGFYCYMYEWCGNPEDGHQALRKYNQSKNLDFIWQTASYETRLYVTGADLLRGPLYSNMLHGKPWANSNDTATLMSTELNASDKLRFAYTDTVEKNRRMFMRSAGFNICTGGQLQEWFALHDDWYSSNQPLLDVVAPINALYDRSKNYDRTSNSQILIVTDEVSCSYTPWNNSDNSLLKASIRTPQLFLTQMGAPNDQILLDDISLLPDPNQYKLVIFLNCWNMTNSQRALVDSLKGNNRVLVFCYAQGYFNGNSVLTSNMESVIGMTMDVPFVDIERLISPQVFLKSGHPLSDAIIAKGVTRFGPLDASYNICRRIYVNDASASRLGTESQLTNSYKHMAIKDMGTWQSIYCISTEMPSIVLREIARYAGVHIYNENDDTFYANKCFVNIHPNHSETEQYDRTITFPVAVDVYDAITDTLLQSNTTSYTRSYYGGETMMYRYVPYVPAP